MRWPLVWLVFVLEVINYILSVYILRRILEAGRYVRYLNSKNSPLILILPIFLPSVLPPSNPYMIMTACLTACPRFARRDALRANTISLRTRERKDQKKKSARTVWRHLTAKPQKLGERSWSRHINEGIGMGAQRSSLPLEDDWIFLAWENHDTPPFITVIGCRLLGTSS